MPPSSLSILLKTERTSSSLLTSHTPEPANKGLSPIAFARASLLQSIIKTFAPSAANLCAVARPIPLAAPVTITLLPFSSQYFPIKRPPFTLYLTSYILRNGILFHSCHNLFAEACNYREVALQFLVQYGISRICYKGLSEKGRHL